MKMLKKLLCFLVVNAMVLSMFSLSAFATGDCTGIAREYIVLLGEEADIVNVHINTDLLVIDSEYFTGEQISTLKQNGAQKIYSYINIGSIENFRDYYSDYEQYTLGDYENWPEEKWMDVSQPPWQSFLRQRVQELAQKGIDGFFVDNTDVYYHYHTADIYNGLVTILTDMRESGKDIIINGGDTFVSEYIESGSTASIFDGVNQENVYTSYDFDNGTYGLSQQDDRDYYVEYLDDLLANNYIVYVLEYANDANIAQAAKNYSNERGYICYVSQDIELLMPPLVHTDQNADGVCDICGAQLSFNEAKIHTAPEKEVEYRCMVTIRATATGVPEGYFLAMYMDGRQVAKGTNSEVTYSAGYIKSDINYIVKVVDASGNVMKDGSGQNLSKAGGTITCDTGFVSRIIAFFKGIFGLLPSELIKP